MSANLGVLIGLPILLATANGLTALEVGVVLVPIAVLTGAFGVLSGRLVDSVGARALVALGGTAILVAVLGLSTAAGEDVRSIGALGGLLGAGFGLVNTPLAAAVSRAVRPQLLASGLGINSMMFFIGGSVGAAALLGLSSAGGATSLNPLHDGAATGFSDGFLVLALPVLAVLYISARLPGAAAAEPSERQLAAAEGERAGAWRPDCSVPWVPGCEEWPAPQAGMAQGAAVTPARRRPR